MSRKTNQATQEKKPQPGLAGHYRAIGQASLVAALLYRPARKPGR